MYLIVVGSLDAPLHVTLSEDPQADLEMRQRRRADVVRLYHAARVQPDVAATTLEYLYVLLGDWQVPRKKDWFDIAPDDAKNLIDRAIVACAVVDKPPPDLSRVRTELPTKVARALHALADQEGGSFADLAREAVILLYASRDLAAPLKEKS